MSRKSQKGLIFILFLLSAWLLLAGETTPALESLLPQLKGWAVKGEVLKFSPENLFEYINGAAEAYLSYDFQALIAAEYEKAGSPQTVSVEIYDMGSLKNAFGIYSAERYPDSNFISVGLQGYEEEGVLNFFMSHYYIKLLAFDSDQPSPETLRLFAAEIARRIGEKGDWPTPLKIFPAEGRVANSEKFILKNFLGYDFLHNGYMASYRFDAWEFDCFIIEAQDLAQAKVMLDKYLQAKKEAHPQPILENRAYQLQDRYYQNVYIAQRGRYILGVMKIPEGKEKIGLKYLQALLVNCPE